MNAQEAEAIIADQKQTIEALYFALNERNAIVRELSAEVASLRNVLRLLADLDNLFDENVTIARRRF